MSDLVYFGSNGAYGGTDSTTVNMQMIGTGLAGLAGQQSMFPAGIYQQSATATALGQGSTYNVASTVQYDTLADFVKKVSKPAKAAARGILAKLQEEIDGWHGDILERRMA